MRALTLAAALILTLGLAAFGLDPRCDDPRHQERPECQTTTTTAPTTTTTVPGTTTTAGSVSAIAGVGCSNTKDAVEGYLTQSAEDNLILVAAGGHTVEVWANNTQSSRKDPWGMYLDHRPAGGYTGVWFQLCERVDPGLTTENVVTVLEDLIWANDPGIPVWLSPLNFYETESCAVTGGNTIPNQGAVIADELAATLENVFRGPDLGPLTAGMVRNDNCHPNTAGVDLLGSQLVGWFD